MKDLLTMTLSKEKVHFPSLGDQLTGTLFLPGNGNGLPAMIVCHGAGEFKENYFELCECLAERGIAALAVDMHGHGESEGARFYVDMDQWVADVRAAVDFLSKHPQVGPGRIGAFGLSSGGTAILEASLVEPRLKALVALDATVRSTVPWLMAVLFKGLILLGTVKRLLTKKDLRMSLLKLFDGTAMAADPEIERRIWADPRSAEAFKSFPLPGAAQAFFVSTLERVPSITVPTLVLWGEEDQLDPPETARMLHNALMCKKKLAIIPGNGHVGHLDRHRDQVFALTGDWALENLA